MGYYLINGGKKLSGRLKIQGSKNSAVAVIMAALSVKGVFEISNLPKISDVNDCLEILRCLNCKTSFVDENTVIINTENASVGTIPCELLKRMRASSYLIGAMLGRFGICSPISVGGCNFGTRPLNYHISAMEALGAVSENDGEYISLFAENGLSGGTVDFPEKTVGGTINAIIAAIHANGITVIKNAAKEPHVCDVADFFVKCGATVSGIGTDEITVIGNKRLHGCAFEISPDMIEAGTYLLAGLATGGAVTCENAPICSMYSIIDVFSRMNAKTEIKEGCISAYSEGLSGTSVVTEAFPGFPTDLHPQLAVLMGVAEGESTVTETVFKSRFRYLEPLKELGLNAETDGERLYIHGKCEFKGGRVKATDLRGGAALIIAALAAKGESKIENAHYIIRGYSDTVQKLTQLGADIKYIEN